MHALTNSGSDAVRQGANLISNGMPSDPLWYQKASVYQAHVRSFMDANGDGIGDFAGLTAKLDHVQDLGHDSIWLLPFMESPLKDGGYDIANYLRINPQYGTMADFDRFIGEAHKRGIRVITELVLNHTSDQHEWFARDIQRLGALSTREQKELYAANDAFYVWDFTPKHEGPPSRWSETRVIFQDFEPSNWTWNEEAGGWYWHRFYAEQPDLNWDNPQVVQQMHDVVDFWLDKGVDGIRLDAVPYLFERDGFNGENLRETHDALKALRAHVDGKYADRMLLAEANMPANETLEYFGDGDEVHAAFNFPLMPRLYLGTLFGNKQHVIEGLELTGKIPDNAAWLTFLRNHDEMTLEKVTPEIREAVKAIYREGRPAEGIVADERAPINLGVRLRVADLLGHDQRRIEMMHSMLYSQPGTPIMYYGDEIGMATHRFLNDRDGVRTAMQWDASRNGGFSATEGELFLPAVDDALYGASKVNVAAQQGDPNSLLERMRTMLAVRAQHPSLKSGDLTIIPTGDDGVLAYSRRTDGDEVVSVVNLTGERRTTTIDFGTARNVQRVHGSDELAATGGAPTELTLEPYGYQWLQVER
jgi:maltose alpha-D-glucosyltransferase/alpha-amylase